MSNPMKNKRKSSERSRVSQSPRQTPGLLEGGTGSPVSPPVSAEASQHPGREAAGMAPQKSVGKKLVRRFQDSAGDWRMGRELRGGGEKACLGQPEEEDTAGA